MSETTLALIAIIVSVMIGAVTFAYTHQQMKEARAANKLTEKAQREQAEPYVVADIRDKVPGSGVFVFVIENTGPTMARDVQVAVSPRLKTTLGDDVEERLNAAVARKIPVLPPSRQLVFLMDSGLNYYATGFPRQYTVSVQAYGPFGAVEPLTYIIDLDVLENSLLETESLEWSTRTIAKESEKSRKAQEKQAKATTELSRTLTHELRTWRSSQRAVDPPSGTSGTP